MPPQDPKSKRKSSSRKSADLTKNPVGWLKATLRDPKKRRFLYIGRWFILSIPALWFLWTVFGIAQNNTENRKRHLIRLGEKWREYAETDNDKALIMASERLLGGQSMNVDDLFRLYDSYLATGKSEYGLKVLEAQESLQPVSEMAEYRARLAEKLFDVEPRTNESIKKSFDKFQQSLSGPLSKATDKKVRVALASLAKSSGNVVLFMEVLRPLAAEDREVSTELLWTEWLRTIDEDSSRIRSQATQSFERMKTELFQRMSQLAEKPTDAQYMQLAKLYVIAGRPEDFFVSIRDLPSMSDELKSKIEEAFEEMKVLQEVARDKPRSQNYSSTLVKILNREKFDKLWIDLAARLWSTQDLSPIDPIRLWMQKYRNSEEANYEFFMNAAQFCHARGKWADARDMYERAVAKEPDSLVALNNLAAMYYRFPPRDLQKALELSEKALKLKPDMLGVAETRAQVLARMGKIEEARVILESALPAFPREWNIHNTLAQIYRTQGKSELAEIHSKRAAELNRPLGAEIYENIDLTQSASQPAPAPPDTKTNKTVAAEPKKTDR